VTCQVLAIDPATYARHAVHGEGRIWTETNCYVDIWIELLHALGRDPVAALPFTFAIDFEGDQWTFFKFPAGDLYELYGLDVQELALWRPLVGHLEEQLARGRPVLVELDSFFLPDTAGTAYGIAHVKSTVAVTEIDSEHERLGYFHGQTFHRLSSRDFRQVLRVDECDPSRLPPFAELVKISREPSDDTAPLVLRSLDLLRRHLCRVPAANPIVAFRRRLARDLDALLSEDLEAFHRYSFATLRQCGAAWELSATYLRWLGAQAECGLDEYAAAFERLAEGAKRLQFQLARSMTRRSPLDLSPLDDMAADWQRATSRLQARYHQ
jgi:hypothetical protein